SVDVAALVRLSDRARVPGARVRATPKCRRRPAANRPKARSVAFRIGEGLLASLHPLCAPPLQARCKDDLSQCPEQSAMAPPGRDLGLGVDARLDQFKLEDWIKIYTFIRRSVPPRKTSLVFDTNVAD